MIKLNELIEIWAIKFGFTALERPDGHERVKKTIKCTENANTNVFIPVLTSERPTDLLQ